MGWVQGDHGTGTGEGTDGDLGSGGGGGDEGGGRSVARLYMKESHLVDLGVGIQDGGLWGGEWRGEQSEQ